MSDTFEQKQAIRATMDAPISHDEVPVMPGAAGANIDRKEDTVTCGGLAVAVKDSVVQHAHELKEGIAHAAITAKDQTMSEVHKAKDTMLGTDGQKGTLTEAKELVAANVEKAGHKASVAIQAAVHSAAVKVADHTQPGGVQPTTTQVSEGTFTAQPSGGFNEVPITPAPDHKQDTGLAHKAAAVKDSVVQYAHDLKEGIAHAAVNARDQTMAEVHKAKDTMLGTDGQKGTLEEAKELVADKVEKLQEGSILAGQRASAAIQNAIHNAAVRVADSTQPLPVGEAVPVPAPHVPEAAFTNTQFVATENRAQEPLIAQHTASSS